MPETVTILEATAEANHHMAVQKATNIWKEKSKIIIPDKPGYLSEKSFRNGHSSRINQYEPSKFCSYKVPEHLEFHQPYNNESLFMII